MEYYTTNEKVSFVQWYFSGNSLRNIRDLFAGLYPNRRIPSTHTISSILNNFKTTGNVHKLCSCKRRVAPREDPRDFDILARVAENKNMSTRQIAQDLEISHTTVLTILKKQIPRMKSYKYKKQQEILEHDNFSRMVFCELMIERINNNRNFSSLVLFSDECSFSTKGVMNSQNFRYWHTENLHLSVKCKSQYRDTLNIWAGILGHRIIGPFFIDGKLNADKYLDLLQNQVGPVVENLNIEEEIWFQHDGCPAHNSLKVREYLNGVFGNRWIGRGGAIHWPPRSPDLAPNDFFLWGYLKNKLYNKENSYNNVNDLREAIIANCDTVSQYMLANTRLEFYNRLGYCLAANGGLFEQYI